MVNIQKDFVFTSSLIENCFIFITDSKPFLIHKTDLLQFEFIIISSQGSPVLLPVGGQVVNLLLSTIYVEEKLLS